MRIAASITQIDNHYSLTQSVTQSVPYVGIELLGQLKMGTVVVPEGVKHRVVQLLHACSLLQQLYLQRCMSIRHCLVLFRVDEDDGLFSLDILYSWKEILLLTWGDGMWEKEAQTREIDLPYH